jgi:hypothetical protein
LSVSGQGPVTPIEVKKDKFLAKIEDVEERSDSSDSK